MTIKNPYKFITRLLILFLLVAGLYVYLPSDKAIVELAQPLMTVTLEVSPGDTLWNFGQSLIPENPRKGVYIIKKINGLEDDQIYPGQLLEIPYSDESLRASNN